MTPVPTNMQTDATISFYSNKTPTGYFASALHETQQAPDTSKRQLAVCDQQLL
jgi:hypothetical protein